MKFKMKKKNIKILLVDDDSDILEIIEYNLSNEGYKIYTSSHSEKALKEAKKIIPHLIILDIMMPVMDGIELCETLRKEKKLEETVIMFLTARGEDYSYIAGLEAGADDYVTKPIKPKVLLSKVKSLLRRFLKKEKESTVIYNNLVVNKDQYKVTYNNVDFFFPKKEFELLQLLISDPQKVFKRKEILESVWGKDIIVGSRTIDVHIQKIRNKLGKKHFKTVKGVGYKFIP